MNFTVSWTPAAQDELAAIWLASRNRNAITKAAARIDTLLRTRPETHGALLFDTVRELIVAPLGIQFEVVEDDLVVFVLAAWDHSAPP